MLWVMFLEELRIGMFGNKEKTGARIEVFLLRELNPESRLWDVIVDPARKIRIGNKLYFENGLIAEVIDNTTSRGRTIRFVFDGTNDELYAKIDEIGETPIPPYLKRNVEPEDRDRYQTFFASERGAVAAPTAGLHFDNKTLENIRKKISGIVEVTLHVGAGTFSPIRDNIDDHKMHSEFGCISKTDADIINTCKLNGGRIIAVGTTTLRLLESAAINQNLIREYNEETDIFIKPGFNFNIVDILLTNFHLPKSSLLLLISAFAGSERVKLAYQEAINNRYRFFSYGDVSLLYKNE